MRLLSSQLVWPRTVIELHEAGIECDIVPDARPSTASWQRVAQVRQHNRPHPPRAKESEVKVRIDRDSGPDGKWRYSTDDMKSTGYDSYPAALRAAKSAGHEVDNAGWLHRMLSWNFNMHAIDGYPEWELCETSEGKHPAFVKLTHRRGKGEVESTELSRAWDDLAAADFYQRDWTDDGIPIVRPGETYWSGWWFATVAERDRFVAWQKAQP